MKINILFIVFFKTYSYLCIYMCVCVYKHMSAGAYTGQKIFGPLDL